MGHSRRCTMDRMKCDKPVKVILFEGDDKLDATEEEPFSDENWGSIAMELVMTGDSEIELADGKQFLFVQGLDRSPLFTEDSGEEAEMFVSVCSPGIEQPRFAVLPLHDEQHELDEAAIIEAYMHSCAVYGDKDLDEDHMLRTVRKILAMRPAVMLVPINVNSTELNDDDYVQCYTVASSLGRVMVYNRTRFKVREERVQEAFSRTES